MSHDEISKVSHVTMRAHAAQIAAREKANLANVRSAEAKFSFLELCELSDFSSLIMQQKFKTLQERLAPPPMEEPEGAEEKESTPSIDKALEAAKGASDNNPELSPRALLTILASLHPDMPPEEILDEVQKYYHDPSNADDVLDFLIKGSETRREVQEKIILAKEKFNASYGREIKAGKNIADQARQFSQKGLGSTTALREIYRDITGNPRDPTTLFEELSTNFEYEKLETIIDFMLHSLSADLKSKGPSIDPVELKRILSDTHNLLAIMGVYKFFEARMKNILKQFKKERLLYPKQLTFILLAKLLMRYVKERYPSSDKLLQYSPLMGIKESPTAQIIIYTQFRDAMRQIAPRLFQDEKHRQNLLQTILLALSDLEDLLEEEEDEES